MTHERIVGQKPLVLGQGLITCVQTPADWARKLSRHLDPKRYHTSRAGDGSKILGGIRRSAWLYLCFSQETCRRSGVLPPAARYGGIQERKHDLPRAYPSCDPVMLGLRTRGQHVWCKHLTNGFSCCAVAGRRTFSICLEWSCHLLCSPPRGRCSSGLPHNLFMGCSVGAGV